MYDCKIVNLPAQAVAVPDLSNSHVTAGFSGFVPSAATAASGVHTWHLMTAFNKQKDH